MRAGPKRLAVAAARAVGLDALARARTRHTLLVVCYHGVDDGPVAGRAWTQLPLAEFERQLRHLAAHFDVLPIDEALDRLWGGALRRPTACVTFDDGYRNNATHAAPVLRALGVPATIYLATGFLGTDRLLWTTRLELAFQQARGDEVDLSDYGLGRVAPRALPVAAVRALRERLKTYPQPERERRLRAVLDALGGGQVEADPAFRFMTWDEARALAAGGLVTFGAHTVDHELVSRLDDAALEAQLGGSVAAVQDAFAGPLAGAVSRTFAYPNGRPQDFDPRSEALLRPLGIRAAVSTIDGRNTPATPRFAVRRLVVGAELPFDEFCVRAAGVLDVARGALGRA